MKNDWHHSRWNVFRTGGIHNFWAQKRSFWRAESRTRWRETQKVQSNRLPRVTIMNKKRMPRGTLNFRLNGRRQLGSPSRRLLDKINLLFFLSEALYTPIKCLCGHYKVTHSTVKINWTLICKRNDFNTLRKGAFKLFKCTFPGV